jgi:hypothetical protein
MLPVHVRASIHCAAFALASCAQTERPQLAIPNANHYTRVEGMLGGSACSGEISAQILERALGSFESDVPRCLGYDEMTTETPPQFSFVVEISRAVALSALRVTIASPCLGA